jgi:hypothetical protein
VVCQFAIFHGDDLQGEPYSPSAGANETYFDLLVSLVVSKGLQIFVGNFSAKFCSTSPARTAGHNLHGTHRKRSGASGTGVAQPDSISIELHGHAARAIWCRNWSRWRWCRQ